MDGIFRSLQTGLADTVDAHFYIFDKARKGALHGFGVYMKTLGF